MGHGATPDLARLDLLAEVIHADVLPQVAAEVHQDGVDAPQGIEQGREVVVVVDLRGEPLAHQAEFLQDEAVRELHPIVFGIGCQVRVEVPCGAAEFARERHFAQQFHLAIQALHEDLDLLAEVGGRGRLAVCACQHGDTRPIQREAMQAVAYTGDRRQVGLVQEILDQQWQGRVVDVLAREREMHEFTLFAKARFFQSLFQEVLDGLHVVVRHLLDGLDPLGVAGAQLGDTAFNRAQLLHRGAFQLRQWDLAQEAEIGQFHLQPITHQGLLAEPVRQRAGAVAVPAVDRRDGGEGVQFHGRPKVEGGLPAACIFVPCPSPATSASAFPVSSVRSVSP